MGVFGVSPPPLVVFLFQELVLVLGRIWHSSNFFWSCASRESHCGGLGYSNKGFGEKGLGGGEPWVGGLGWGHCGMPQQGSVTMLGGPLCAQAIVPWSVALCH